MAEVSNVTVTGAVDVDWPETGAPAPPPIVRQNAEADEVITFAAPQQVLFEGGDVHLRAPHVPPPSPVTNDSHIGLILGSMVAGAVLGAGILKIVEVFSNHHVIYDPRDL